MKVIATWAEEAQIMGVFLPARVCISLLVYHLPKGSLILCVEKVHFSLLVIMWKSQRYLKVFSKLSILHNNEKPYAEGEILIENAVFQMLTESIEDSWRIFSKLCLNLSSLTTPVLCMLIPAPNMTHQ